MITLPPWPPSPPLGPPRGAYFSRRKLRQPLPPAPPCTKMATRSTNIEYAPRTRQFVEGAVVPGADCVAGTTLIRRPP